MLSPGECCDCDSCPRSWDAQLTHARRARAFGAHRLVRQSRVKPSWRTVAWLDTSALEQDMAIYPVTDDERTCLTETDGKDTLSTPSLQPRDAYWNPWTTTCAEQDDLMDCMRQETTGKFGLGNEDLSSEGLAYRIRRVRAYMGSGTTRESELRIQLSLITMGNQVTS